MRLPRLSPEQYRRITFLALFAVAFIILTGAAVRLTGSGLGCKDWPNCEPGHLVPKTFGHGWIEYGNRLVTGLVSVMVIVAVLGALRRVPRRRDLTRLSLGLVAGIIGQIILGALAVKFDLRPPFVMAHFLLSLVIVANALLLHHRAAQPDGAPHPTVPDHLRLLGRGVLLATCGVVVAGTVVTATGPHGGDQHAKRFGFSLESVARVHGSSVMVLSALVIGLLVLLHRHEVEGKVLRATQVLLGILLVQAAIGYTQYFEHLPALLVWFHVGGAVAVWITAVQLNLELTERVPATRGTPLVAPVPGPVGAPPGATAVPS